jgi:hypothetical protein
MRRSLSVRIAMLVFVVFAATAPAFAAPRRDASPIGGIERAISRVFKQIIKSLTPLDVPVLTSPIG